MPDDSKIQELYELGVVEGSRQEHVARLQVAMHQPHMMRFAQRPAQPAQDLGRQCRRQRCFSRQALGQGFALEILHGDKEATVVQRSCIDQPYRMWASEGSYSAGLSFEPKGALRVILLDDFKCHFQAASRLKRIVDASCAAPPQESLDLVATGDSLAQQRVAGGQIHKHRCVPGADLLGVRIDATALRTTLLDA